VFVSIYSQEKKIEYKFNIFRFFRAIYYGTN